MSKRRKLTARSVLDRYFQEWHIKRTQATTNTDEEWVIDVPHPIEGVGAGRFYAIEVHSIEGEVGIQFPDGTTGGERIMQWCLTTSPRTGKLPFITGPGDPSNLWFRKIDYTHSPAESNQFLISNRLNNLARYTDNKGYGKLIIGDHLYLQCHTDFWTDAEVTKVSMSIEWTGATVSCVEYAAELVSQLDEA